MPVSTYKIWAVGSKVADTATAPIHVGVAGVAKTGGPPGAPATTVANEMICNRLASVLLLPIPPGFLIQHDGKPYFVSLNFNLGGHGLPPVDPAALVAAHPELAWGIVLFDILILNSDRHTQNINFDTTSNTIQIFDHSHALLANGIANLAAHVDSPGIGGHCLREHITTLQGLDTWAARIAGLQEYYLRAVVDQMVDAQFSLTGADAKQCADWLNVRRTRLRNIVNAHQNLFPKIPAAEWNPQPANANGAPAVNLLNAADVVPNLGGHP